MIDFACKQIELDEVIKCSFSLNKTEYKILGKLMNRDSYSSVIDISRLTGFERSTVQKAIKNLMAQGLVKRSQTNMSRGGYVFRYKTRNKDDIKDKIVKIIGAWTDRAKSEISKW